VIVFCIIRLIYHITWILTTTWEWTRTQVNPQYKNNDPNNNVESYSSQDWNGIDLQVALIMRGGSWGFEMSRITEVQVTIPENFSEFLGFRCITSNP